MKLESSFSAFNARWLDPEDVARSFVPTWHYGNLVRHQHSLLMGPRGCGKTTLLKMLTRRAQRVWRNERKTDKVGEESIPLPNFEALYIPSDVRWSAELEAVSREVELLPTQAERLQRSFVSLSCLIEATRVFQDILDERDEEPTALLKALIKHFDLGPTVPTFAEVRLKLQSWAEQLNSFLVRRDSASLIRTLDRFNPALTGHALDTLIRACSVYEEYVTHGPSLRWALCFDELEIAPAWLQTELFASLRSTDQRYLLKLTWSPLLPTSLTAQQERQHDYAAIRMWHGHVAEAKPFCREFSTRFIRTRFEHETITPRDVFGISPFSQEEDSDDNYERGTAVWNVMRNLAERDGSFRDYLVNHHLDPADPRTSDISLRDETLRKIKPIVLVRDAYFKDARRGEQLTRRSRKNPVLYFGEDAVYSMSEGNPRLLASLLNDLLDAGSTKGPSGIPKVKPDTQSRILTAASHRTLSGIRTYPIQGVSLSRSLSRLLQRLGDYLHGELVTRDFNADPAGSFIVDDDTSPEVIGQLQVGLLLGALVHVRSNENDIPHEIVGSRIRLSYMLSPAYRILFRNYRDIRLSTAMRILASTQRTMFNS